MAKKNSAEPVGYDSKRWQAEDDARTLIRAQEVRNDKARMAAARAWAKEQVESINQITKKD